MIGLFSEGTYDLPLKQDSTAGFVIMLTALMTFLAVCTMAGSLALNALAAHWSTGLENQVSVEIPAEKSQGGWRNAKDISDLQDRIQKTLKDNKAIAEIKPLDQEAMADLLSPWLGGASISEALDDLPMPGLVGLTLSQRDHDSLEKIKSDLHDLEPDLRLDDHQSWLGGILRLCHALQGTAMVATMAMLLATALAIAGAIRARIAILRPDVELLHLMGASDTYIMRQFQRHALFLSAKGAAVGSAIGLIVLIILVILLGHDPALALDTGAGSMAYLKATLIIATMPLCISIISTIAARLTVLSFLRALP